MCVKVCKRSVKVCNRSVKVDKSVKVKRSVKVCKRSGKVCSCIMGSRKFCENFRCIFGGKTKEIRFLQKNGIKRFFSIKLGNISQELFHVKHDFCRSDVGSV